MQAVIDASAVGGWFFEDEWTTSSDLLLDCADRGEVCVPALWWLEIGTMLLTAQRRGRIDPGRRVELLRAAAGLPVAVDLRPVQSVGIDTLAETHALTTYDGCYLELALHRGLPLATRDDRLKSAMLAAGVGRWYPQAD